MKLFSLYKLQDIYNSIDTLLY